MDKTSKFVCIEKIDIQALWSLSPKSIKFIDDSKIYFEQNTKALT